MKRLFDIFFSFIGHILFFPLIPIIAIFIKLDSSGSVFFIQKKIGKNFKPFVLYKFRTMLQGISPNRLPVTPENGRRLTSVGRFLRKARIDGLPQLWNVLKGDMSFVGPRPMADIASLKYSNEEAILKGRKDPEEYYIHIVLPERIKLAKEYVKKASFLYDIKLILFTIYKLAYPQNTISKIIDFLTPYRKPIVIVIQSVIFVISNYLAFFIRFDADVPLPQFNLFWKYLPFMGSVKCFV